MMQSSFLFASITNLEDKMTKLTSSIDICYVHTYEGNLTYGARLQMNVRDELAKKVFQCAAALLWKKLNPLRANPTKWSNTLKQFIANLHTNCLSVFDHYVTLALKGLRKWISIRMVALEKVTWISIFL